LLGILRFLSLDEFKAVILRLEAQLLKVCNDKDSVIELTVFLLLGYGARIDCFYLIHLLAEEHCSHYERLNVGICCLICAEENVMTRWSSTS